jgi:hypothetical protein
VKSLYVSGIELMRDEVFDRFLSKLSTDSIVVKPNSYIYLFHIPVYKTKEDEWRMNYRHNNLVPTKIRRKDLVDINDKRVKFRIPFPKKALKTIPKKESATETSMELKTPTMIRLRTIHQIQPGLKKMLSDVLDDVQSYNQICVDVLERYKNHETPDDRTTEEKLMEMRLKKIALTVNTRPSCHQLEESSAGVLGSTSNTSSSG